MSRFFLPRSNVPSIFATPFGNDFIPLKNGAYRMKSKEQKQAEEEEAKSPLEQLGDRLDKMPENERAIMAIYVGAKFLTTLALIASGSTPRSAIIASAGIVDDFLKAQ